MFCDFLFNTAFHFLQHILQIIISFNQIRGRTKIQRFLDIFGSFQISQHNHRNIFSGFIFF